MTRTNQSLHVQNSKGGSGKSENHELLKAGRQYFSLEHHAMLHVKRIGCAVKYLVETKGLFDIEKSFF